MSDEEEKEDEVLDLNSFRHDDDELVPGVEAAEEDLAGLGLHVVSEDGEAIDEEDGDLDVALFTEEE